MLNISPNSVQSRMNESDYQSFYKIDLPTSNRMFKYWLSGSFLVLFLFLFLPWTQNIQTGGNVTTLNPGQRPQSIEATIAGRINHWYVREGQFVKKGDTIAHLTEIKVDYFDDDLVNRTKRQVEAKNQTIGAYGQKANALSQQIQAMQQQLRFKKEQLENKLQQAALKIENASANLKQAEIDFQIAEYQYRRTDTLYQKGIKSLTDLEGKRLKVQETEAKVISARNKLAEAKNDEQIAKLEFSAVENEYANKIAKARSDRFSTLSNQYDAEGSVTKLEIQYQSYLRRSDFYYVTAPQDCFVNQAVKKGIGETVKEGEALVTIMPADFDLAVELFVAPMDLPLVQLGQEVRFIFDGWPAFIFSGWPSLSFGTYHGHITAIENNISDNGKYRVLVSSDNEKPWPEALRVGSGAQGIALLNDVPLWYELWRQLNGFPPDFYYAEDKEEKLANKPKMKAPVKSLK
ncbi:MAG: HlyD family efflux transporter periplasmic adaptor subunit [Bacteroidota bacterium]